jgi:hypothetical protein
MPIMANELFVLVLALFCAASLFWGFKVLPAERWQVLAAVPRGKKPDDTWEGLNFTYYGFFVAGAYVMGAVILFVLLGALRVPVPAIFLLVTLMAAVCLPASKLVAAIVERKAHTLTVGGASFVGIILAPGMVWVTGLLAGPRMGLDLPVLPVLAGISVAYAFGEGLGRLACISFGCCYGKPLSSCHPFIRFLFKKNHFVFWGKTKKIAYAHGLDQIPVFPVQAVTSVIYITAALGGTYLFLTGRSGLAFLLSLLTTQLWRLFSEFLRADYRGQNRVSAYQWMSLLASGYGLFLSGRLGDSQSLIPDILAGLSSLWHPALLIFFQALWLFLFFFTGRSVVTGSVISVKVIKDRI